MRLQSPVYLAPKRTETAMRNFTQGGGGIRGGVKTENRLQSIYERMRA